MAQVDLTISGVISENTATPASNMESDDGNTCNFLNYITNNNYNK